MKSDGRFICVCPPKGLSGGGARRKSTDEQVAQKLSQFHLNSQVWLSDGGGLAVSTPSVVTDTMTRPETFVNDNLIVAFCGELTNLEQLVTKTLFEEMAYAGGLPEANLSARVVGTLYTKLQEPEKVVAKLRGTFAFVVHDTATVRMFAARDNSGDLPLYQGRLEDGTVVVSNYRPEGFDMDTEVPAGHFVFGNSRLSVPQKFSPALGDIQQARTQAQAAASRALEGLLGAKREPLKLVNNDERFTVVVSKAQKRKAKARMESAKANMAKIEVHQPIRRYVHTTPASKGKKIAPSGNPAGNPGRADKCNWWRKVDADEDKQPKLVSPPEPVADEEPAPAQEVAVQSDTAQEAVDTSQKEQIEEAVRILHHIASSGKIQSMLQQTTTEEGMKRTPSCSSDLHRVESLQRVNSMQRVGSDLQSLLAAVN